MMRLGMVLKLNNDYALIATDDSNFFRIKLREGMRIGQKIYVFDEDIISLEKENEKRSSIPKYLKVVAALAACIVIAVIINSTFVTNNLPLYAMVSLDINPSFELGIDDRYNVVQISAVNEESKEILDMELIGKPLSIAVSEILYDVEESGYALESDNAVLVSTINFKSNDDEPLQKIIADGVRLAMLKKEVYKSTKVIFIEADEEDIEAAEEQELSVGKYRLLEMSENKIDKAKITEGRVSDLIKEEEIKDDLENDEDIEIIDEEDFREFNQIEEDVNHLKDIVNQLKDTLNSNDLEKIEDLFEIIEMMENQLINEESEFEDIHELIEELQQLIKEEEEEDNEWEESDDIYEEELEDDYEEEELWQEEELEEDYEEIEKDYEEEESWEDEEIDEDYEEESWEHEEIDEDYEEEESWEHEEIDEDYEEEESWEEEIDEDYEEEDSWEEEEIDEDYEEEDSWEHEEIDEDYEEDSWEEEEIDEDYEEEDSWEDKEIDEDYEEEDSWEEEEIDEDYEEEESWEDEEIDEDYEKEDSWEDEEIDEDYEEEDSWEDEEIDEDYEEEELWEEELEDDYEEEELWEEEEFEEDYEEEEPIENYEPSTFNVDDGFGE